ncbi:Uncharacterized protein APZ42_011538 [Daphnia magna]|uniref:Uncharacterized protein n=1 Tax=Daphnia magna TaxID=35525 RepID=A0A0N8DSC9_9CRUS|nr:Uncharacterized protein APZ42_011538 [Daphnia magna]
MHDGLAGQLPTQPSTDTSSLDCHRINHNWFGEKINVITYGFPSNNMLGIKLASRPCITEGIW